MAKYVKSVVIVKKIMETFGVSRASAWTRFRETKAYRKGLRFGPRLVYPLEAVDLALEELEQPTAA
jgi:hypothetical protein